MDCVRFMRMQTRLFRSQVFWLAFPSLPAPAPAEFPLTSDHVVRISRKDPVVVGPLTPVNRLTLAHA